MKIIFTVTIFLLFCLATPAQEFLLRYDNFNPFITNEGREKYLKLEAINKQTEQKIDSIVYDDNDHRVIRYIYDKNHRITNYISTDRFIGNGLDTTVFHRDANGYCIQKIDLGRGDWKYKTQYIYDSRNRLESIIDSLTYRKLEIRHDYMYDPNYNLTSSSVKDWNYNQWVQSLYKYNYNKFNIIEKVIVGSRQENFYTKSYSYDSTYCLVGYKYTDHSVDDASEVYHNCQLEYDSHNEKIQLYWESWDTSIRDTSHKNGNYLFKNGKLVESFESVNRPLVHRKYDYDEKGNLTQILFYDYLNESNNNIRQQFEYDSEGRCVYASSEKYDSTTGWNPYKSKIWVKDWSGRYFELECYNYRVYYPKNNLIDFNVSINLSNDTTSYNLTAGSFYEGKDYFVKQFTIPEHFEKHREKLNIFEGARFTLDEGAINEDVSLDIRFMGMAGEGRIENAVDDTPLFMFLGIEVTGEQSGVTSFEDFYYFNKGKKARIVIPRTEQFLGLLEELEIDETNISFAYVKGGEYFDEGLEWEIKEGEEGKVDSLCLYLDHFSQIVGGKNLLTSIKTEEENLPTQFSLDQNYPNPFNPVTTINYYIPSKVKSEKSNAFIPSGVEGSVVQLIVYDVLGREVKTLVNEPKQAGRHSVTFDATKLSSGVYYYQLKAGDFIETKKMVLMK